MPHDMNGTLLQKGDRVIVEMTVRDVYPGAEMCNISLERRVAGEQSIALTCQAKQLLKVAKRDGETGAAYRARLAREAAEASPAITASVADVSPTDADAEAVLAQLPPDFDQNA